MTPSLRAAARPICHDRATFRHAAVSDSDCACRIALDVDPAAGVGTSNERRERSRRWLEWPSILSPMPSGAGVDCWKC